MIDINCDVGEGLDNEHLLMPYISSCNIACGGHAGDSKTMNKVVTSTKEYQVKIGAHPSYPDRENFGRKSMQLSKEELSKTINEQIELLKKITDELDTSIHHIKPHGALYNDLAKDTFLANTFLDSIQNYKKEYALYVPFGSAIATEALRRGFDIIYEAFADRNYNNDLTLVSRKESNAVITDTRQIVKHISMMRNEKVKSATGKYIPIRAATFCVHSDTKNVVDIVRKIHGAFTNI